MQLTPTLRFETQHHDGPRQRTEIINQFQHFHSHYATHKGKGDLMECYCHAIMQWVQNPNTDLYHIEMLFDEISHAVQQHELPN